MLPRKTKARQLQQETQHAGAWGLAGGARCGVPRGTLPTGSGRAPRPPCGARSRRLPGPDICVLSPEGVEQGPGADEGEGRAQEGSRAGKRGLGKGRQRRRNRFSRQGGTWNQALERQDQRGESATSLQLAGDKTSRSQQAAVTPWRGSGPGGAGCSPHAQPPASDPGGCPGPVHSLGAAGCPSPRGECREGPRAHSGKEENASISTQAAAAPKYVTTRQRGRNRSRPEWRGRAACWGWGGWTGSRAGRGGRG